MAIHSQIRLQSGKTISRLFIVLYLLFSAMNDFATGAQAPKVKQAPPVTHGKDGRLIYMSDERGNTIPDFSYCGYMASEIVIPQVPVRVVVPALEGDATNRIQSALDYVATLPADKDGFRGTVLLGKGVHLVKGGLKINGSGIVLRGSGMGTGGTVLLAAGNDRRTLISIFGNTDQVLSPEVKITDPYVPVNAHRFNVGISTGLSVGDQVRIHRPSTAAWIETLGCDHFGGGIAVLGWKPGTRDIFWDRKITSIKGSQITVDAPLTTALDSAFGGGSLAAYNFVGRIRQIGIENLCLRSAYDNSNPKDEDHSWMAITLENCCDTWVRQVTFEHFAGSAVAVFETAQRVTIEDCKSLTPVSEIGGQRRNTFFSCGQQTLFQRCYAEYGCHDFAVGQCAAGPNAFVQCESVRPFSFSGTIDCWASGVLFDVVNIDGQALSYMNRGQEGQGAGWSAANSVFWQCSAARIDCFRPPTANNWAFGTWAQFSGDGYWNDSNNHIRPLSLFYAQLSDRLGRNTDEQAQILRTEPEASSSPSVEIAAMLTAKSYEPQLQMTEWIDLASTRNPISIRTDAIKTIDQIGIQKKTTIENAPPMRLQNGWLVRSNQVLTGKKQSVPYWNTNPVPAVTRFVPGRVGGVTTDDLNDLTGWMQKEHILSLEQNYGLWYDRRRDDHERIRRMDGDVWPPFYELPFARSGNDTAWDGLSKYDLTKYNPWYWSRLKKFADLADQKGLVLINQNYFQHNIIEAGAHWADFPWRPANNINYTGFPEPPPYAGDKRIFLAQQFYNENHPVRRPLHEAFIRKCLDNFSDNSCVIQYIGEEFTGPFHFVRFWLETIQKWEKETGKKETIGLAVTKDVQDSVLNDPKLAAIVDLIDIRYWFYRADGSSYSPKGGLNLSPRQHARLIKPGQSSFEQVYRAIREYHSRFPEKAVTFSAEGYDAFGWAVFMSGGSLAAIPSVQPPGFLESASGMSVTECAGEGLYQLQNGLGECIVYCKNRVQPEFDWRGMKGKFQITQINPNDGTMIGKQETVSSGKQIKISLKGTTDVILWIKKCRTE